MCNSHMDVYFEEASYTLKSKILIESRTRSKPRNKNPNIGSKNCKYLKYTSMNLVTEPIHGLVAKLHHFGSLSHSIPVIKNGRESHAKCRQGYTNHHAMACLDNFLHLVKLLQQVGGEG